MNFYWLEYYTVLDCGHKHEKQTKKPKANAPEKLRV